mmetsp:Transcript_57314/g.94765  ORF Transcript_57314/g.94765 Transcript_57314/m.94765 type:complete len:220 (-) Transcript_57314:1207-1866(-)
MHSRGSCHVSTSPRTKTNAKRSSGIMALISRGDCRTTSLHAHYSHHATGCSRGKTSRSKCRLVHSQHSNARKAKRSSAARSSREISAVSPECTPLLGGTLPISSAPAKSRGLTSSCSTCTAMRAKLSGNAEETLIRWTRNRPSSRQICFTRLGGRWCTTRPQSALFSIGSLATPREECPQSTSSVSSSLTMTTFSVSHWTNHATTAQRAKQRQSNARRG